MDTLESGFTGLCATIADVLSSKKAIAQLFYGLEEEPSTNTVGLVGTVYSPKSKGQTVLRVDKADYDKMKHMTLEEITKFEESLSSTMEQWMDLPSYLAVRFSWTGTYSIDYVIEPVVFLSEVRKLLKPRPDSEDAEPEPTTTDSVAKMAPPTGSAVGPIVPLPGKSGA